MTKKEIDITTLTKKNLSEKEWNELCTTAFRQSLINDNNKTNYYKQNRSQEYVDWCLTHVQKCLDEISSFVSGKLGLKISKGYGLSNDMSMHSIPQTLKYVKEDKQVYPMPFTQLQYEKMLACDKIKLCPTTYFHSVPKADLYGDTVRKTDTYLDCYTNWFAGNVEGNLVLFKETIAIPIAGSQFRITGSTVDYPVTGASTTLKAFINGHNDVGEDTLIPVELYRCDYNPVAPHKNFLDKSNSQVLKHGVDVYGSHIHLPNAMGVAFKPYSYNHTDAMSVGRDVELTFGQTLLAVRNAANIPSSEPVFSSADSFNPISETVIPLLKYSGKMGSFEGRCHEQIDRINSNAELKKSSASFTAPQIATFFHSKEEMERN